MESALFLLLLLFFIELAETTQYQGATFDAALNRLYHIAATRPWQFLLYHSSLGYVLYVAFAYELLNIWTVSIILTKVLDLAIKLYLFAKIRRGGYFSLAQYGMEDMPLDWKLRYFSVVLYTGLFIPAIL